MTREEIIFVLNDFNKEIVREFFPNQYIVISMLIEENELKEAVSLCIILIEKAQEQLDIKNLEEFLGITLVKEILKEIKKLV